MPLASGHTGEIEYAEFITAKEKLWSEYGYGPWAFEVDGHFVGWGGLQPESDDVEIALVLSPEYWGLGKIIYTKIIEFAFKEMKLESVIILFPPSRTRIRAILKAGFRKDGEITIEDKSFIRYRLNSSFYLK